MNLTPEAIEIYWDYILTSMCFTEDRTYLIKDGLEPHRRIVLKNYGDELDTFFVNPNELRDFQEEKKDGSWPKMLIRLERYTERKNIWTQKRTDLFMAFLEHGENKYRINRSLLSFCMLRSLRPSPDIALRTAIMLDNEELILWVIDIYSIKPGSWLANLAVEINCQNQHKTEWTGMFQLYWLYRDFRILPTIYIPTIVRAQMYSSQNVHNFCIKLNKYQQHTAIINVCLAMSPLRIPAYVLLEIIDWAITGMMSHYQKIMLIIKVTKMTHSTLLMKAS
jgi:hypothetical protein